MKHMVHEKTPPELHDEKRKDVRGLKQLVHDQRKIR